MDTRQMRRHFEESRKILQSSRLTFDGVDGYDVYNCSIPFVWRGRHYIYGRVERRGEWARSTARLFQKVDTDRYQIVPNAMVYPLEDPFIAQIHGELVLGGTHVRKKQGQIDTYYGYFYRGQDPGDLRYFTTGPDCMKDIRLVELADGRIGVFSRPRGDHVMKKYGCESIVGFAIIDSLDQLDADTVENAPKIENLFGEGEWGGCNQCYLLGDGSIGVIAHKSYMDEQNGIAMKVYTNISFVVHPNHLVAREETMLATARCYPAFEPKMPDLADCAFTSGITPLDSGRVALYSGVGDTGEGKVIIDEPFQGHGGIRWLLT